MHHCTWREREHKKVNISSTSNTRTSLTDTVLSLSLVVCTERDKGFSRKFNFCTYVTILLATIQIRFHFFFFASRVSQFIPFFLEDFHFEFPFHLRKAQKLFSNFIFLPSLSSRISFQLGAVCAPTHIAHPREFSARPVDCVTPSENSDFHLQYVYVFSFPVKNENVSRLG